MFNTDLRSTQGRPLICADLRPLTNKKKTSFKRFPQVRLESLHGNIRIQATLAFVTKHTQPATSGKRHKLLSRSCSAGEEGRSAIIGLPTRRKNIVQLSLNLETVLTPGERFRRDLVGRAFVVTEVWHHGKKWKARPNLIFHLSSNFYCARQLGGNDIPARDEPFEMVGAKMLNNFSSFHLCIYLSRSNEYLWLN